MQQLEDEFSRSIHLDILSNYAYYSSLIARAFAVNCPFMASISMLSKHSLSCGIRLYLYQNLCKKNGNFIRTFFSSVKRNYILQQVVQLCKFDYRLSNKLSTDLQKLRCRVNYHALRFTDPIRTMGKTLVNRMRMQGKHYVALHLRY